MKKPKTLYSQESARLCDWLREQRLKKGLSIRDLGTKLGWHPSIVGKIEQGERRIDVVEYVAYCRAMGVEPSKGIKAVTQ